MARVLSISLLKVLLAFRNSILKGCYLDAGKTYNATTLGQSLSSVLFVYLPYGKSARPGNEVVILISTKEEAKARVMKAAQVHTSSEQLLSSHGSPQLEN